MELSPAQGCIGARRMRNKCWHFDKLSAMPQRCVVFMPNSLPAYCGNEPNFVEYD